MRVGVVTSSYPRTPGDAAGSFVAEHVAWLRRAGHHVDVVCAGDATCVPEAGVIRVPAPGDLFYAGGAPERLETSVRAGLSGVLFSARLAWSVRELRYRRWDGIIGHWLQPAMLAALAAPHRPVLAIAHSGDVDLLCRARLAGPALELLRRRRARLVVVAEHLRDRLADATSGSLSRWVRGAEVVPMGVDAGRLRAARRAEARRVVFLGRMVAIKGIDTLLRALPELAARADVVIAGGGPRAAEVAAAAARCGARALGWVHGSERDRLLGSARVVVVPSLPVGTRREGAPVAAIEAMAAGAAVVASRTGGLAELPPETVSHVPPGDPDALVRATLTLLDDARVRERQCRVADRLVAERDWSRTGPRLLPPTTPS